MLIQKIIKSIEILSFTDFLLYVILFSVIYVFNFYYKYFNRPNPCPGPLPLPIIGNLHNLGIDVKMFYKECQKKYGDICEFTIYGQRCIILSRPKYFEKILSPKTFSPKLSYSQGMDELGILGHGIVFNDDYKSWNYNRQFITQSLLLPKFIETSTKATIQLFEELSEYWQSIGKQNSSNNNNNDWTLEVNFAAWFHGFTNDIISILITGERTYSLASYYNTQSVIKSEHLDALIDDGNNFVKEIVKIIEGLLIFMFCDKFSRQYVPIIREMSIFLLKSRDYIFGKLDMMIKKRRKAIEKLPAGEEMKTDMLTSLIIANTEKDTSNISPIDSKTSEPMTD
ncbi:cytochrome P450 [Gigaspora margarita]|uniref:Cytochrome P450 n=1 Tax=Gigaspora margarita TaxID=4874 RepID=A0A8H4ASI4_GIGMA|nr:cytochrome P450 [Gigaspora margarita]